MWCIFLFTSHPTAHRKSSHTFADPKYIYMYNWLKVRRKCGRMHVSIISDFNNNNKPLVRIFIPHWCVKKNFGAIIFFFFNNTHTILAGELIHFSSIFSFICDVFCISTLCMLNIEYMYTSVWGSKWHVNIVVFFFLI